MRRTTKTGVAALCTLAAALFVSPQALAQNISVSGGFADVAGSGPIVLVGDQGFSVVSSIARPPNIVQPFDICGIPGRCVPGASVDLLTAGSGEDGGGTATLDGVSYVNVGGANASSTWQGRFTGSVVLPAWASHTSVSAPFSFSGSFRHPDAGGLALNESIAGAGTATLFLDENVNAPGSWRLSRLLFRFDQGLPDDWTSADIGDVGQAGDTTFSSGEFTIDGAGADIWGTADAFHYVFETLPDGGALTARVNSMENIATFSKAGVMARWGLGADAPHVILDVNPGGNVEFMSRADRGGPTAYLGGTTVSFPVWLRLSRAGRAVTASVSQDGGQWNVVGSFTPSFLCCWMLGGLAVGSHDVSMLDRAIFDQVAMTAGMPSPAVPSPWQQSDVGETGLAGSATFANGTFTVTGAGPDIWGTADAFHFVYLSSDAISARVTSMQNTNQFAKAGVMLRDSLDAGSAHVILDETPLGNIEFMSRAATGQETSFVTSVLHGMPVFLRLIRGGGAVTGSVSTDGLSWTVVGAVPDTLASSVRSGLAVTSHDVNALNAATFDSVAVGAPEPPDQQTANILIDASDVPAGNLHGAWHAVPNGASPGGVTLTTNDAGASQVDAPLAAPNDYFDVTFDAIAGVPYTIWLRLQAAGNSKTNDSVWVQFADALADGAPVYRIGTTSGLLVNLATDASASSLSNWGWQNTAYWLDQATTVTFATTGPHTLRVQVREDGVSLDQIVLSPQEFLSSAPGSVTNGAAIVPGP
jgi:hypothetical protein